MIIRSASLERGNLDREINERLHAVAAGIDRDLATTTITLKALASSPSLADGDLKAFYTQAMAAQEVGGDHFFLTSTSAGSSTSLGGISFPNDPRHRISLVLAALPRFARAVDVRWNFSCCLGFTTQIEINAGNRRG
jgi:hypothetical protein